MEIKGSLRFTHFKIEDYKHINMTWGGSKKEMRRFCVGLSQHLLKTWKRYHALFHKSGNLSWGGTVMALAHGKGSMNINLVVKTMSVEKDCLCSDPGSIIY